MQKLYWVYWANHMPKVYEMICFNWLSCRPSSLGVAFNEFLMCLFSVGLGEDVSEMWSPATVSWSSV